MISQVNFVNLVVVAETLAAIHLVAYYLPKRSHFALRTALSTLVCLAVGFLFYVYQANNYLANVLYTSFMYGMLALLPGLSVLFCRKMTLWEFLFCVAGGHTLHQLPGEIYSFFATVTGIGELLPANAMQAVHLSVGLALSAATLCVFFFVFVLKKKVNLDIAVQKHKAILFTIAVVIVNIILSSTMLFITEEIGRRLSFIIDSYNLVSVVLELFILFSYLSERRLENELQTINILWKEKAKQYEITKQNIEAINVKCHDIRHRIEEIADKNDPLLTSGLNELKENISVYDSVVKTGNDILDVVLTEKSLYCERNSINLSVIADGKLLGFMSAYDLYCLFENALSNAIEAVMRIQDTARRSISILVKRSGKMVSIHIENFFAGPVALHGDEIATSKADELNHGFGLKSMKMLAEKYGGELLFGFDGDIFLLDILFSGR